MSDTLREKVVAEARQALRDVMTGLYDETALVPLMADRILALVAEDRAELVERLTTLADKWDDYDRKRYTGCHSGYAYELREVLAVNERSTP